VHADELFRAYLGLLVPVLVCKEGPDVAEHVQRILRALVLRRFEGDRPAGLAKARAARAHPDAPVPGAHRGVMACCHGVQVHLWGCTVSYSRHI
jgi:hypothetical protein